MARLDEMVGRLTRARLGLDRSLAIDFLNERMRTALHRWPTWAGLVARAVIPIPDAYAYGTVTTTAGSDQILGDGTNQWPVDDLVSTTLVTVINIPGGTWVQVASTQNMRRGTILWIDAGQANPEALPVLDIIPALNRVYLTPLYSHPQGATITVSSLAGLQFRLNNFSPIFTVWAVNDSNTLTITPAWGERSAAGQGYQIILMYTPIAADVDSLQVVYDPVQAIKLRLNVPQEELAIVDPNRQAVDSPTCISPIGPNAGGLLLYEIFPAQSTRRQLAVLYRRAWPNMRLPWDQPPPWIPDNLMVYGGLATAYATPCPRGPEGKDPGYSLDAAIKYEQMFENSYIDALTHDQAKAQSNFTWDIGVMYSLDDGTEGALYGAIAGGAGGGAQSFPPSSSPSGPPVPPVSPTTPLSATASLTSGIVPDGTAVLVGTITLPTVTVGMPISVGVSPPLPIGVEANAQVTSPDTVSVYLWNLSGTQMPGLTSTYTVLSLEEQATPTSPANSITGVLTSGAVPDGSTLQIGTLTLPGATLGTPIGVGTSPPLPIGVMAAGQVTATNTVTITLWNLSGGPYGGTANTYTAAFL